MENQTTKNKTMNDKMHWIEHEQGALDLIKIRNSFLLKKKQNLFLFTENPFGTINFKTHVSLCVCVVIIIKVPSFMYSS